MTARNFGLGGVLVVERCPSDAHKTASGMADSYPPRLYQNDTVGRYCAACGWREDGGGS